MLGNCPIKVMSRVWENDSSVVVIDTKCLKYRTVIKRCMGEDTRNLRLYERICLSRKKQNSYLVFLGIWSRLALILVIYTPHLYLTDHTGWKTGPVPIRSLIQSDRLYINSPSLAPAARVGDTIVIRYTIYLSTWSEYTCSFYFLNLATESNIL